jgi:ABC-type transport system involved in multi-copper enzyme maturation permease subunit
MKVIAIARNTAREALRNKVLYSILAFAAVVVVVAGLFGSASIGDQTKFVKDFSLAAISLFGVVIAVTLGVNMLAKELGRRTILNILSKPVARWEFVAGKFLGLSVTVSLVVLSMSVALVGILGAFEGHLDPGLLVAAATIVLELTVVVAIALFFSSIVVTPTLAGLFTIAAFVAGRSAGYLGYFRGDEWSPAVRTVSTALYWILPHLNRLDLADQVAYGHGVSLAYLGLAATYALAYAVVLLAVTTVLFERREFV